MLRKMDEAQTRATVCGFAIDTIEPLQYQGSSFGGDAAPVSFTVIRTLPSTLVAASGLHRRARKFRHYGAGGALQTEPLSHDVGLHFTARAAPPSRAD